MHDAMSSYLSISNVYPQKYHELFRISRLIYFSPSVPVYRCIHMHICTSQYERRPTATVKTGVGSSYSKIKDIVSVLRSPPLFSTFVFPLKTTPQCLFQRRAHTAILLQRISAMAPETLLGEFLDRLAALVDVLRLLEDTRP